MEKITGNYGKCLIGDCLDYMKGQPDKSIDLIFTDTVWGHDYHLKAQKPMGINKRAEKQDRVPYNDEWNPIFHQTWFTEAQRVSHAQVVCVGKLHLNWWYKEFNPIWQVPVIYKNGQGSTLVSRYSGQMPYLCFGEADWWKHHKFHRDFYETYIHNGFLRDNADEFKHPSPKDFNTWHLMISDLNNEIALKSVYDPFTGSCCLGEVCETIGIKWIGTEIKPEYADDIKIRIQKGVARRIDQGAQKQQTLMEMIKHGI